MRWPWKRISPSVEPQTDIYHVQIYQDPTCFHLGSTEELAPYVIAQVEINQTSWTWVISKQGFLLRELNPGRYGFADPDAARESALQHLRRYLDARSGIIFDG